jgi:TolB-like protein/tetratricopeptide (TPR) repeat protein
VLAAPVRICADVASDCRPDRDPKARPCIPNRALCSGGNSHLGSRYPQKVRSAVTVDAIQEELERILVSSTFQQADRLRRFLTCVVEETKAGRGSQLKEYVLGVQVFDKDTSFDPRTDPIVRVQARRLRARLARYYETEGHGDPVLIDLPKGGYAPVFKTLANPAPKRSITSALASRNSIIVLPFADQSPGSDLGFFCQGICQELIHTIAKISTLRMMAADSKGREDVALLLTGGVRRSNEALRVTIQLIDASSGTYLWSESLDGTTNDIFGIQEAAAQAVFSKLGALDGPASFRARFHPHENLAARNLCVQGRYHINQRTEEGLRKAVEFFEKAVVEDSRYAEAFSGLADAYGLLANYGVLAPADVWTKAATSAASAVMLDEHSVESHTSLAHVKSTQDWDWPGAEKEFRRALSLNPSHATAHHWYGISCLGPMARLDEALEELLTAHSLDPVSPIIARDVAMIHYYRREFDAALEQCDLTIELNPHFSPAYWALGIIQEQQGEFDESAAAFERAIQLSPKSPRMHAALGRTLALSGKRKQAIKILHELHALSETRYVSPFDIALIHFAMSQTTEGFEWLTKAFQDRAFELLNIQVDPRFDALRDDERFISLTDRLELPESVNQAPCLQPVS